jgi:hypothetical protein
MRGKGIAFVLAVVLLIAALAGASLIPIRGAASTQAVGEGGPQNAGTAELGGAVGLKATGKITPARTTCADFRNGTAPDLPRLLYGARRGRIDSVAPGLFAYYGTLSAMPAAFTIQVKEMQAPNLSWPWLPPQAIGQVVLYDASCARSRAQGATGYDPVTGTVTIRVSGAAGSDYYLGIEYDPAAVKRAGAGPRDPVVTYRFQTWIDGAVVTGSQADLDLVFKK